MSKLSMQIEGLREAANRLDEIGISTGHDTTASAFIAHDVSERMRSAAYTIESLKNTLQELQDVGSESRYTALFGTPKRAARTIMHKQLTYDLLEQCDECPHQTDECFEPSGKCAMDDYDTLVEWLCGKGE